MEWDRVKEWVEEIEMGKMTWNGTRVVYDFLCKTFRRKVEQHR